MMMVLLAALLGGTRATAATRQGPKVLVAAAADLRYAMDSLVALYTKTHPEANVQVVYGSSGNFFAQIQNGAPFDLFFSADMAYVEHLREAGKLNGPVIRYAMGHLVLWSLHADVSKGMSVLKDVAKIAIANPEHAPYGQRAVESLKYYKIYDAVRPKLVMGENISQAAQFAESGSADVGLIALSLALSPPQRNGHYWEIPEESHGPLEQGFALLAHAAGNTAASDFAAFVQSPPARELLHRFGFQ